MKNGFGTLALTTTLLFTVTALAADKVVVIPLGGEKSAGDAVASDVLAGKTFSNAHEVGINGTMATQTLGPDSSVVPAGYYEAASLEVIESDLNTSNIRKGVTIFGITGLNPGIMGCISGVWDMGICVSDCVTITNHIPLLDPTCILACEVMHLNAHLQLDNICNTCYIEGHCQ